MITTIMEENFNWPNWYSQQVRIIAHFIFWIFVVVLYYLNYSRIGGDYIWLFVFKELLVTGTLFYSASWIISKLVIKGNLISLPFFFVFAYIWWLWWTFATCYIAQYFIPKSDQRFDLYLKFILENGFLGLFNIKKFAALILDFIMMVSIPLAPKLTKVVLEGSFKMVKLERDNLEMELNFLKSEVPPHFLFNILNIIYRMSEKKDPTTPDIVLRLSNLVRYMLYQTRNDKILLYKEIELIRDYIDLVGLRYGGKVPIRVNIGEISEPYKIIPLILVPLIENAFKHGPERSRHGSWVDFRVHVKNDVLSISVKNGVNSTAEKSKFGGLGLSNIQRRLNLHYPKKHILNIKETENSYNVELTLHLK